MPKQDDLARIDENKFSVNTAALYSHSDFYEDGSVTHYAGDIECLPNRFERDSRSKGQECLAHFHDNVEFMYFIRGNIIFHVGGKDISFHAGDLMICNSRQMHSAQYEEEVEFISIILDIGFTDEFGFTLSEIAFQNKVTNSLIQKVMNEIDAEIVANRELSNHKLNALLQIAVIELLRNHTDSVVECPDDALTAKISLVKKVMDYLSTNHCKKITLDNIASCVNFNKSYITRIFKQVTKHTIWEHLNLLRCRHANKLLVQTDESIETIARTCGFESTSYFRRTYKEFMGGVTPTDYRKQKKG